MTARGQMNGNTPGYWLALGLSIRTSNSLLNAGITSLDDVTAMSDADLMSLHMFGVGSLAELREKLGRAPRLPANAPKRSRQPYVPISKSRPGHQARMRLSQCLAAPANASFSERKRCSRCGKRKEVGFFYGCGTSKLDCWCMDCRRDYNREWRRKNAGASQPVSAPSHDSDPDRGSAR